MGGRHRRNPQPKRGRLWLNDGSCIRLRPEYPGHVWAYHFVEGRTHDGRKFRILTIIDEASRECLALIVARQLKHEDVLAALADLFIARGPPANIRSDNGSEFIATAVQKWLVQVAPKVTDAIKGRYVLIGGDFADFDQFDTPFTRTGNPVTGELRTHGVELHATLLAQIFDGFAPSRLPAWLFWLAPLVVVGTATVSALFAKKSVWVRLSAFVQPVAILAGVLLLKRGGVDTLEIPAIGWFFAWLIAFFTVPVMPKVVDLRT